MNRREFLGLARKAGVYGAALLVAPALSWELIKRVGAVEDWYAEAATLPQNYLRTTGSTLVDTSLGVSVVSSQAVWTGDAVWALSEVIDEDHLWPKNPVKPTKGLKLVCTQAGTVNSSYRLDFTVAVVPNNTHNISLMTRGENLNGHSQGGTVRLAETTGFAKYYEWNTPHSSSAGYESKWFPRTLLMSQPITTSGSPVGTNTHVVLRLILNALAGDTPTYYIGSVRLNTIAKPQVTITLDDAPVSDYTTSFPYMRDRGIVGASAVDMAGTNNSIDHLLEMQAAGWSMHNHTQSHANLPTLTEDQMRFELENCRDFLYANGLTSGHSVFVTPYGARNAITDRVISGYYSYAMVSQGETLGFPIWQGITTPMQIDRVAMDAPTSSSTIIGYINSSIDRGNTINIYGHDVQASAPTGFTDVVNFKAIIDHVYRLVSAGVIGNPNLQGLFTGMTNPRKR